MRKNELLLLAGVVLITAGCSNDETVEVSKGQEIAFSGTFVNKAGRGAEDVSDAGTGTTETDNPDLTATNFAVCKVWGSSSIANNYIFDGTELTVVAEDSTATYLPPRYWDKSCSYHFMAIGSTGNNASWTYTPPSPIPSVDGLYGSLTFDNSKANGVEDIAYAGADYTTTDDLTNMQPISLNFMHALSRIRFSFVNAMEQGYYLEIKDVTVKDLPSSGTLTFGNSSVWTNGENNYQKSLDIYRANNADENFPKFATTTSVSTVAMFTIPTANSFKVSFGVNLWVSNGNEMVCVNGSTPYKHEVTIDVVQGDESSQIKGLLMGNAYAFKATISKDNIDSGSGEGGLQPIEFTVSVTPFSDEIVIPTLVSQQ